jgi:DNA-binding transcriptional regulator YiaG
MKSTKQLKFEVPIPSIDGQSVTETVDVYAPVTWDEELKEYLLTAEGQEIIENAKARHMGLLLPSELSDLRERLGGLTQKEIGDLLQIGEKTWTRWESGKQRPSRSLNLLLRALYDREIGVDYLRGISKLVFYWEQTLCNSFEHPERDFIRMDDAVSLDDQEDQRRPAANQELAIAA